MRTPSLLHVTAVRFVRALLACLLPGLLIATACHFYTILIKPL